jgi:16S rRNA processing protein RimM
LSNKKIVVGKLFSAHGIKGALKFGSFTENPDTLFKLKPLYCGESHVAVKKAGQGLLAIEGVTDRTQAEAFRNRELWVFREQLPPPKDGEYYIEDLIGFKVVDVHGEEVGSVVAFHHYGAGDIMEISIADKKTEMFGFEQVEKVDIEKSTIHLKPVNDSE